MIGLGMPASEWDDDYCVGADLCGFRQHIAGSFVSGLKVRENLV